MTHFHEKMHFEIFTMSGVELGPIIVQILAYLWLPILQQLPKNCSENLGQHLLLHDTWNLTQPEALLDECLLGIRVDFVDVSDELIFYGIRGYMLQVSLCGLEPNRRHCHSKASHRKIRYLRVIRGNLYLCSTRSRSTEGRSYLTIPWWSSVWFRTSNWLQVWRNLSS